jgi:hypothetical protein
LIAKLADNSDKSVRENALKVLSEIYKILDEGIWKIIGEVSTKVQGLLEQRFKKFKMASGGGMGSSIGGGSRMTASTSVSNLNQKPSIQLKNKTPSNGAQDLNSSAKKTITPRGGNL